MSGILGSRRASEVQTTTRSAYPTWSGEYVMLSGRYVPAAILPGSVLPPSSDRLVGEWTGTRWVVEYPLASRPVVTACVASTWPHTLYLTTGGQTVTLTGGSTAFAGIYGWRGFGTFPARALACLSRPPFGLVSDCQTFTGNLQVTFILGCNNNVIGLAYVLSVVDCPNNPSGNYGTPGTLYFSEYSCPGGYTGGSGSCPGVFSALTTSGATVTGSGAWSGTLTVGPPTLGWPNPPTNTLSPPVTGAFALSS